MFKRLSEFMNVFAHWVEVEFRWNVMLCNCFLRLSNDKYENELWDYDCFGWWKNRQMNGSKEFVHFRPHFRGKIGIFRFASSQIACSECHQVDWITIETNVAWDVRCIIVQSKIFNFPPVKMARIRWIWLVIWSFVTYLHWKTATVCVCMILTVFVWAYLSAPIWVNTSRICMQTHNTKYNHTTASNQC